jgi:hypothetical protein
MNGLNIRSITWLAHSLCFFIALALCSGASGKVSRLEYTTNDHLEPPDERFEPMYRKLLSRRLFVTPANYARVVNLPSASSIGESTVAIYSKPDRPDEVFITCTSAASNLYAAALSDDPNILTDPPVRINRCDAKFPKQMASVISEAIGRLLVETRARKKGDAIILHGTEIEFSIENRSGRSIRGLLTPYAKGKNGTILRRLAELLRLYCESKATFRSDLARKIDVQARLLIK